MVRAAYAWLRLKFLLLVDLAAVRYTLARLTSEK
jgi:hypothetical protein